MRYPLAFTPTGLISYSNVGPSSLSGGNVATTGTTSLKNAWTCASSSGVAGSEDLRSAEQKNLACSLGWRAITENKAGVQGSALLRSGVVGGR